MFHDCGKTIKVLAYIVFILGLIISLFLGMATFMNGGIITIIFGCLGSWISGLLLYGFGQVIENTDKLVDALPKSNTSVDISSPVTEPKEPPKPWICYSCGTTNHARAAYCIKCDTNRGWSEEQSKQK